MTIRITNYLSSEQALLLKKELKFNLLIYFVTSMLFKFIIWYINKYYYHCYRKLFLIYKFKISKYLKYDCARVKFCIETLNLGGANIHGYKNVPTIWARRYPTCAHRHPVEYIILSYSHGILHSASIIIVGE